MVRAIRTSLRWIWYVAVELKARYIEHNLSRTGGQLAYFFLLSIFPFISLALNLLSVLGIETARLSAIVSAYFSPEIANVISQYIEYVSGIHTAGIVSFHALGSIYSASKFMGSLVQAVNLAEEVTDPHSAIRRVLSSVSFTIGALVFITFEVVISLLNITTLRAIYPQISDSLAGLIDFLRTIFQSGVGIAYLAHLYMHLPTKNKKFYEIIWGMLFALLGLTLMSMLYRVYVDLYLKGSLLYGGAGSLVFLLVYTYFAGIILVAGSEINSIISHGKSVMSNRLISSQRSSSQGRKQ